MKNAIVTGANGFIGSSLIRKLIDQKISVVAVDRSFEKSRLPESELITKVENNLEIDDVDVFLHKIPSRDYEIFYHLAWNGVNGPDKADPRIQIKNIEMTINYATIAKRINCSKLLCAGTIAEQIAGSLNFINKTNGGMMYGVVKHATHLMLETYCKKIDLNFIWMQFSNIYGPENKTGNLISYTIDELVKGREATFGPALQLYDFIFVDDLVEAIYRLGNNITSRNFYFIGSGEPRQLKDYLLEIGYIFGRPELIKIGSRPDDGIRYTVDMFDTEALKSDIGDYISKSFTDGIRYTIEHC